MARVNRCLYALFKTSLYILLVWLGLVALYCLVPSPLPNDINKDGLTKLNNGETVVRVYKVDDFFPNRRRFQHRSHVVLTFQWSTEHAALSVSPTSLVHAVDKESVTVQDAPVGDTDGISLPYFAEADAVLLYRFSRDLWYRSLREYVQLPLSVKVLESPHQNQTLFSVFAADPDTFMPFDGPPMVTVGFATGDHRLTSVRFPSEFRSCLAPSSTVNLRKWLFVLIAPIAVVISVLVSTLAVLFGIVVRLAFVFILGWFARELYERYLKARRSTSPQNCAVRNVETHDHDLLTQEEGKIASGRDSKLVEVLG